jgi:hypothetical protein
MRIKELAGFEYSKNLESKNQLVPGIWKTAEESQFLSSSLTSIKTFGGSFGGGCFII